MILTSEMAGERRLKTEDDLTKSPSDETQVDDRDNDRGKNNAPQLLIRVDTTNSRSMGTKVRAWPWWSEFVSKPLPKAANGALFANCNLS